MCYLPVLSRVRGDALWFAPAAPGTVLVANHFGILEPAVGRRDLVRAQKLDLILLPLVVIGLVWALDFTTARLRSCAIANTGENHI